MSAMRDVVTVFENIWKEFVGVIKKKTNEQKNDKSTQIFLLVALLAAVGYGGFRVYKWRIAQRESKAHTMFSESMQLYMKAQSGQEQWDDVAGAFSLGYEQNSSSQIAPFFKLFQADSLMQAGQKQEGDQLMESAISELPKNSPFADLYKIKSALLNLDSKDETIKNKSLETLEKISTNTCAGQSLALYYLGSYYWQQGDVKKAQELWAQLPKAQEGDYKAGAPIRDMVANKLGS